MRAGTTSSPPYSSSPISLSRSLAGPLHRSRSQVGTEVRQGREGKQPYIHPPAICQQSLNLPSSHPLPHPTLETPFKPCATLLSTPTLSCTRSRLSFSLMRSTSPPHSGTHPTRPPPVLPSFSSLFCIPLSSFPLPFSTANHYT